MWKESGHTKWVSRLNLLFHNESRSDLQQRIRRARKRRERIAADARYKAYVEQQPWKNVSIMTRELRQRLLARAHPKLARLLPATVRDYLAAAEEDFRFAVRSSIVNHHFLTVNGSAKLASANVQPPNIIFPVPDQGCVSLSDLPPGRVAICSHAGGLEAADVYVEPIHMLLLDVAHSATCAQPLLLDCMQSFYRTLDVRHLVLVDTQLASLAAPVHLDAFVAVQKECLEHHASHLTTEWLLQVGERHGLSSAPLLRCREGAENICW